nr:protein NRT1/ PTR FAMILY 8.2-like [Tanacetum cinerariifolium]
MTCNLLESKQEEDIYTEDGTLDYLSNPANKKKTETWKACGFILGNECCERLAYYAMGANLVRYLKYQLNEHSATASRNFSIWAGTCYLTPLIGAFVADTYLGRYWTITTFSIIYTIGMGMVTLSASVPGLKPTCYEKDVCSATNTQTALCFTSLYLVALGTGGIKPCVSSYGADQFDDNDEVEKKQKGFFDKAAVVAPLDHTDGLIDPWKLCSVIQVEELKAVFRLLPMWATGITYSTVHSQLGSLFVLQGSTLHPRIGSSGFEIPPASLSMFDTISILFWVPVYDRVIFHVAR